LETGKEAGETIAMALAPVEHTENEVRVKAIAMLIAAITSVIFAVAIVLLLVTQPWSDGWEVEPRSGPGILAGSGESSGPSQGR
jgi:hypothetical protein